MATKKTREDLRQDFKNGLRPNQEDFAEVFESFVNFEDDINSTSVPPVNFKNGLTISGGNDNPNLPNGTIRWDGNQFVQLKNGVWTTFGGSKWEEGNYNAIFYKGGDVGIGIDPNSVPGDTSKLVVDGKIYSKKDGFKFPDGSVQTSAAVLWEKKTNDSIVYNKGNVGIGIDPNSVPGSKLVVDGKIYSKNGGFKFPDGTEQTSAAVLWEKKTNDSIVYNKGDVGIGTTSSPTEKLEVGGNFKLKGNLVFDNKTRTIKGIPVFEWQSKPIDIEPYGGEEYTKKVTFNFEHNIIECQLFISDWSMSFASNVERTITGMGFVFVNTVVNGSQVTTDVKCSLTTHKYENGKQITGSCRVICFAKIIK